MRDAKGVSFESKVGASLITTTTDVGGGDRGRAKAKSAANASGPENRRMSHRTQLSSVTSGFSWNSQAEQEVLEQKLNLGPRSFDCV